jgi:Lrp/AsnC family leucine-responsive transcriptional regulator
LQLDAIDRRILSALQADARLSFQDLGSGVGLSAPAAYQRVKKLEEAGVVAGFHARLDASALGRDTVVYMRVLPRPDVDVVRLVERWRQLADVMECHRLAADGAYLVKLSLRSPRDAEEHLDAARQAGCDARLDLVLSTVFQRWTLPVAEPATGVASRR